MQDIRKLVESGKVTIGTDTTLKAIKEGTVKKLFLAKNASPKIRDQAVHYASIGGIETEVLESTNQELGTICKKSFAISVLGLKS